MKHTIITASSIVALIAVFVVLSFMVIGKLSGIEIAEPTEPTEPFVVGTEITDRRIIADGTYELLYKTTYSNGLSVSQWQEVDWDDFIRLWEER